MFRLLSFFLFLAVILLPQVCEAQIVQLPPPPLVASSPKVDAATERKALDLIESLSDQIATLHSPANRVRAQSVMADLIWRRDEKRARALFATAVAELANRIAEVDFSDPDIYQEMQRINQSRQELLTLIAAHDSEMAMSALRQTRYPADANAYSRGVWSAQNEANLELTLANLIAAKDPAAALKLARGSLAQGIRWNVISFVPQLYQKDPKLGLVFYQEIVSRIKEENLTRTPDLANVSWNLLTSFTPPQADENTYRDLLGTFLGLLLSANRQTQAGLYLAQNFSQQLEQLAPMVDKYAPARGSEIREWAQLIEPTLDESTRMYRELQRLNQHGTIDEMLSLAAKVPPEYQGMLYQNAAWKAISNGDTARAKEIAKLTPDPVQRRQLVEAMEDHAANSDGSNRLNAARRQINRAANTSQKIDIILRSAESLIGAGDKKAVLDLLNEAKTLMATAPPSAAQFTARLRISQIYLRLDPDQGFALLQPQIARLNEIINAAAVLDGIDFQYFREGEWIMPGVNNLGRVVSSLTQTLAALGQTDFDRARSLADQIERPELRVLVELEMAQIALGGKPVNLLMYTGRSFGVLVN